MHFPAILALLSLAGASPLWDAATRDPHPLSTRSIATTQHVSPLKRMTNANKVNARLQYGEAPLVFGEEGVDFLAGISFGTQTFFVVVDTGSSDTWLVSSGFTCVNQTTNATLTEADCLFGPYYNIDTSFTQIPNENFNLSYADGEYLNGIVGYDSVTLAGITVPKQEVGVVTLAAWDGDGVSSGLVGLAFQTLTSAYPGTNVSADNQTTNRIKYPSIIDTIFEIDNLTQPLFSLALSRDESNTSYGGELAIGGTPVLTDPTINASSIFASAAFEILTQQFIDPDTPEYQFYVINITDVAFGPETAGTTALPNAQFIVDSGTCKTSINTISSPSSASSLFAGQHVISTWEMLSFSRRKPGQHRTVPPNHHALLPLSAPPMTSQPTHPTLLATNHTLHRHYTPLCPHPNRPRVQRPLRPPSLRLQRDGPLLRKLHRHPTTLRCRDRRRGLFAEPARSRHERRGTRAVCKWHPGRRRPTGDTEYSRGCVFEERLGSV